MKYEDFLRDYDDVLLPEQVQKILHAGRNTIYSYLADGTIRSIKVGNRYKIPKLYLFQYLYPDVAANNMEGI